MSKDLIQGFSPPLTDLEMSLPSRAALCGGHSQSVIQSCRLFLVFTRCMHLVTHGELIWQPPHRNAQIDAASTTCVLSSPFTGAS